MNLSRSTTTTPILVNSINRSALRLVFVLILLALACFTLLPTAQAVSPAPDGGYAYGNTAEGTNALFNLTTGPWNSALGFRALYKNATGVRNTAVGYQALYNTNGVNASGTGLDNVGLGANALFSNTTGSGNIAIGSSALSHNTTGSNNIAIGNRALMGFNGGSGNTSVGDSFASGPDYVSIGRMPVINYKEGYWTPGVGKAYINAGGDVQVGQYLPGDCLLIPDLTTETVHINATKDVQIGQYSAPCDPGASNTSTQTVHINAQTAVYVGAVYTNPIAGSPVAINSSGQLGVATSSARFKKDIKPMDKGSETLLALRPVSFRYKKEIDPKETPQFGLVAEEVDKVNPDLVSHDANGKPYTVRYDAVNAMLLNEFLKEHRKVQNQGATIVQQRKDFEAAIAQQQKEIEALTATVKEQAAQIQSVSAQLELSKSAPQTVANNQ